MEDSIGALSEKDTAKQKNASGNRVEAVERALLILEAFLDEDDAIPLNRLAIKTGLYKSTILRLSGSLERFGYLIRHENGHYSLGPSLWRLGLRCRQGFKAEEHIRLVLRHLVEETSETASFYIRDGDERISLYRENSPNRIRYHLEEGVHLPLGQGASGKLLLAFTTDKPIDQELQKILEEGHAFSIGDRDPHAAAVAVAVHDQTGRFRGLCLSRA